MQRKKSFAMLIAVIVVLGFLGGVVGELWLNSFLLPDPYLNFRSYSDLSQKIDELVSNQSSGRSFNERDMAISRTIQQVKPAIVQIYQAKNFYPKVMNSLLPTDFLGQAAIITNDGWLLTTQDVVRNANVKYWVVTNDKQMMETQQVIFDVNTEAAFLKVAANNLPVVEFSLKNDLVNGQSVVLFHQQNPISNNIKNLHYAPIARFNNLVRSSEKFYKFILLEQALTAKLLGSPIITLDGKLAGLVKDASGQVIPIDYLTVTMRTLGQEQTWQRPFLGVRYYDLSEFLNSEIAMKKGAMILPGGVNYNSPARGILQNSDIILKVENDELSANKDLNQLLAQYQVGDTIKLTIKRGDKEMEVEITLE